MYTTGVYLFKCYATEIDSTQNNLHVMGNNIDDHLKWISQTNPHIPNLRLVNILVESSQDVSVSAVSSTLHEDAIASLSENHQKPTSKILSSSVRGTNYSDENLSTLMGHTNGKKEGVVLKENVDVSKIKPREETAFDGTELVKQQKYIKICEEMINLLLERQTKIESTSISFDSKKLYISENFKPRFQSLKSRQNSLRESLAFLKGSGRINELSASQILSFDSENVSLDEIDFSSVNSPPSVTKEVATGKPIISSNAKLSEAEASAPAINTILPTSSSQYGRNLEEVREAISKQQSGSTGGPTVNNPSFISDEEEDDFGGSLMEGLETPLHERDEDDDMDSFIDDDLTPDHTYMESQPLPESQEFFSVENSQQSGFDSDAVLNTQNDELKHIRLSPDVAKNFGISYDEPLEDKTSSIVLMKTESSSGGSLASNLINIDHESDEEIEEIEDFTTQLNEERELTNNEIIEISSDDDMEGTENNVIPLIRRDTILDLTQAESDSEFSDDEDLIKILNKHKQHTLKYDSIETIVPAIVLDEIYKKLYTVFKLKEFRQNQLEAICNTLAGNDVFVLMPTGGGKSLCYQLPALIKSGTTFGTTIVISPLISLMQDQVQHLISKNIKAGMVSSKCNALERKVTLEQFRNGHLDLVYLSPEMVNSSQHIQKIIKRLYDSQTLARIVVDEAHCVSSWGHDFRPDYKGMSFFKLNYPTIPIIALTATANEKVRMDILHHLGMDNAVLLKQSFNRTNLFYEIKWKNHHYLEWIIDYIQNHHNNNTGIIYCHSKQSCENTADRLQDVGIRAAYYHAGMAPDERLRIQTDWQMNRVQVICATIAFGMGIDKPDVRYVIHLFIPRTLEGYYQETGRAGRDGNESECIMFYSYKDARSLQSMIQRDEELDSEGKENHLAKLRQVVQYCENTTDCRRQQVLHYFNEVFNPIQCDKKCDNCRNSTKHSYEERDVTNYAKDIIGLVQEVQNDKVTVLHCQDIFRGSNNNKILKMGHNMSQYHGKGKILDKTDVERIFFYLLSEGCLREYQVMKAGFASNYVRVDKNAARVLNDCKRIKINFSTSPKRQRNTASQQTDAAGNTNSNIRMNSFVSASSIRSSFDSTNEEARFKSNLNILNQIRADNYLSLGLSSMSDMISDITIREMTEKLPTNKKDFSKLSGLAKEQAEYFSYFKSMLTNLARIRKKELSVSQKQNSGIQYQNLRKLQGSENIGNINQTARYYQKPVSKVSKHSKTYRRGSTSTQPSQRSQRSQSKKRRMVSNHTIKKVHVINKPTSQYDKAASRENKKSNLNEENYIVKAMPF